MEGFRLLSEREAFKQRLNIFEFYPKEAYLSDYAILLGGIPVDHNDKYPELGYWWLSDVKSGSTGLENKVSCIGKEGTLTNTSTTIGNIGVRPAIKYSLIKPYSTNERVLVCGLKEVQHGEYPTIVAEQDLSNELEKNYLASGNGELNILNKSFTMGNGDKDNFALTKCPVYEYKGKKYIRCVAPKTIYWSTFHDGSAVARNNVYWVSVEPVTWIVDEENDVALAKHILFSGIPFTLDNCEDYNSSYLKEYIDGYFSKEIDSVKNNVNEQEMVGKKKMKNSYGFDTRAVTEDEIIKGSILSDVPVFIHGKSSDGKSARVKELDPDCEIIYMRNASPESLKGKSVYNSNVGEMIDVPPTWYTKVVDKCNSEPDKIHIVFFDELTNALPSVQGMAFNIILDREVDGKWKLPKNARIVAAGNDLQDSLAANKMAEPLFNRFAHVYINTEVEEWLRWARTPKKSYQRLDYVEYNHRKKPHPAIISYIRYKSTNGQDVLRTPYTGDKPNADPRKWDMASRVLYRTGKPEMLRALIGEPLTKDFVEFVRRNLITVEDVINHNYSEEDLQMDLSEKFTVVVGLSSVDDDHFDEVRKFVSQLGPELKTTFENMWAGRNEKRLEKVAEARLADKADKVKKLQ